MVTVENGAGHHFSPQQDKYFFHIRVTESQEQREDTGKHTFAYLST